VYYVYGNSGSSNFSFVVNGSQQGSQYGSQQVTVTGLNSSELYTVWVQGYSHCAGSSSFVLGGFTEDIGCGLISGRVMESADLTGTPSDPTTLSDPTTITITTRIPPLPQHNSWLIPLILTVVTVLLLIVFTPLLIGVVLYRCYRGSSRYSTTIIHEDDWSMGMDGGYKKFKVKPDVLVLYSLKTPKYEQEMIERCLVARLKQHYHVNSCNDHTEKTIMQWVEEQARLAHSVLIVCNESFHSEWNSVHRGPLLNSLMAIVNSAVSHDNIGKYATVLLKSGPDEYIPDNLYIKGMTKFYVGVEEDEDTDIADIFHFLKQNSKI
jgi:hypothetical protein